MQEEQLKTHFNTVAGGESYGSYEERRWNANPKMKAQQEETEAFVKEVAIPLARGARRITELGAGPGTWTKYLYEAAQDAHILLLDISSEMLARAKDALPKEAAVETMEGDFTKLTLPNGAADYFFSSRAIEYITPKEVMVRMICEHLSPDGKVCVTTKMPKPVLNALSGRVQGAIHRNQIAPHALVKLFRACGMKDIRLYPITFSFPLLRSASADRQLAKWFGLRPLTWISALFAESYGLIARKP